MIKRFTGKMFWKKIFGHFSGEISMAIVGGVNFLFYPDIFIQLSTARFTSPKGKCHAFSENADGYARGEGCGIVILKRLSEANDLTQTFNMKWNMNS